MIQLYYLTPSELRHQEGELLELWAEAASSNLRIDRVLWRQIAELPLPPVERIAGYAVKVSSRPDPVGLILFRDGPIPTIDAFLVRPQHRNRGLGSALLKGALTHLQGDSRAVRFGGGSYHLVPGLPEDGAPARSPSSWPAARLLLRFGFRPDWWAHDLLGRLPAASHFPPTSGDPITARLLGPPDAEALRAVLTRFGARWGRDTEWRLRCGPDWSAREEIMGVFRGVDLLGFCHLWSSRSNRLGPSVFWLDRGASDWAGIGPVGVLPQERGAGLGGRLLDASLSYLQARGVASVGVDWTSIPEFYATRGFTVARSYRGYLRSASVLGGNPYGRRLDGTAQDR